MNHKEQHKERKEKLARIHQALFGEAGWDDRYEVSLSFGAPIASFSKRRPGRKPRAVVRAREDWLETVFAPLGKGMVNGFLVLSAEPVPAPAGADVCWRLLLARDPIVGGSEMWEAYLVRYAGDEELAHSRQTAMDRLLRRAARQLGLADEGPELPF